MATWEDECYLCQEAGDLLCCESCSHVAHYCCYKKLDSYWPLNEETDPYFCERCQSTPKTKSKKLKVLELFKGSGSITKYCQSYPDLYESPISLDIDPKSQATITTDITTWNCSEVEHIKFDILWASPPCTAYSRLRTRGPPADIEGANKIVTTTLEIISYLKPKTWFLENPATGKLKDQPFMKDLDKYHIDVDYCKCSTFGYRKRTRIWTNLKGFEGWQCDNTCGYQGPNGHIGTFGGYQKNQVNLEDRYRIPPLLIHRLFTKATGKIHLPD